jgi:hypothetical protein
LKNEIIFLSCILLIGLSLSEAQRVVYFIYPQSATIEYDLFLSKNYHLKMSALWYIFEISNILNRIIWAYVLCRVVEKVSFTLFKIAIVFLVYQFTQFFFYIWDRNTSFISNLCVYFAMGFIILEILIPEKKRAKVRSFK